MTKRFVQIALAAAALAALSCEPDMKLQYAKGGGVEDEQTMPDTPSGDQTGFTLTAEEGSLREVIGSGAHEFSSDDRIYMRSNYYTPTVGTDGIASLEVDEASSGIYRLLCFPKGSKYWYRGAAENPLAELVIPYSQFYGSTVQSIAYYPLFGETRDGGKSVVLKEIISAVGITLKGNARIASVHLQNKASDGKISDCLAGVTAFDPAKGFVLGEGVDFVNLNCTNNGEGVAINDEGKTFYLVLAPGDYRAGLTLTVTDMDHKGQVFDFPAFEAKAGEVKTSSFDYAPDEDLVFFEHFDNFVWGGNVKGNKAVSSYAPDAVSSPDGSRKGNEEAFTAVGVTTPGSALIQSNWQNVSSWTVKQRNSVNADYVTSRNIGDYVYLYRCQEYQGCVSMGAGDEVRGAIMPIKYFGFDDVFYGVKLSFDICLRYATEDKICTQLRGSGIATSVLVDGEPITLNGEVDGNNTYTSEFLNVCSLEREQIPAPRSEKYTEGWHHVEMTFANMNELSTLAIWGFDNENSIRHGAFVDNIEIRKIPQQSPSNKLRVLLYNIQNGMWYDQGNNFNSFVAFVKKYDPDVCIFCEAQTCWKTGSSAWNGAGSTYQLFTNKPGRVDQSSSTPNSADPLENAQWKALAKRFGHNYHAVSAYHDDYPQVITSKYPVTTKLRIFNGRDKNNRNTNIKHGAGHYQVTVGGKTVNFVSFHMWPFKYAPGESDKDEKLLHGYDYAQREVEGILNATVARTDCGDDWLLMGDSNSISPIDDDYYYKVEYKRWIDEGEKWVQPHQSFRSGDFGRNLYDMLREGDGSYITGPGRFMTTTGGEARMDIMYGSLSMRRRVTSLALVLNDSWCGISNSAIYDPDSDTKQAKIPSDHRPLLIEFDLDK